MSKESEEFIEGIHRDLIALNTMTVMHELRLPDTVEGWIERSDFVAEVMEKYLEVLSKSREFRRTFGHEADEASLNRMDLHLEMAGSFIPELIRTINQGIQLCLERERDE